VALPAATASAELASTPYMGWNTYYGLSGTTYDESTVQSVANAMLSDGLAQAGYRIVWLDAGWSTGARDSSGQLTVQPSQWPDGMAGFTNWLHQRGLLAGIYTDAGATGCNGIGVGSYGHYQQDADTFAAWGFDAVKVDFCGAGQEGLTPQPLYTQFAQALRNNSSARPMILNLDNFWEPGAIDGTNPSYQNSVYSSYQYAPQIGQSWRTDTDIGIGQRRGILFQNVLRNLDADALHPEAAGPGHWNDPDYLGPELGMTSEQAQAQLSMWAIVAAPLILGSDPRVLSPGAISMLENPQLIAIDQDPLGAQGTLVDQQGSGQVWVKPLSNGDRAVALLNRGSSPQQIGAIAWHIGLPPTGNYHVADVWQGNTTGSTGQIGASVAPSSAALYRVSAIPNSAYYAMNTRVTGSGSGRVTSDPGGISCPGACSLTVGQGVPVSLTPSTAPGSRFAGWSGAGCYGTGSCVVTMGSDQTVTATFNALHALNVSVVGPGRGKVTSPAGISCPSSCSQILDQGTPVTLTATADSRLTFEGWLGSGCSGTRNCALTMGSNEAVFAVFAGPTGTGVPLPTGGGVLDALRCGASGGKSCQFTVALTTIETIGGGKVRAVQAAGNQTRTRRADLVGRKTVLVPRGIAVAALVKPNGTGQRLLKQFGRLPVTFKVQLLKNAKQVTLVKKKLTIKPQKAHKGTSTVPKEAFHGPLLGSIRVAWPAL
jgi:hypothetical protein